MAVTPNSMILPQLVKRGTAVCTAAKTTYADNASAALLYMAGPNGSVLRRLSAVPRATVTATQLQLFGYDGTNYWLLATALMGGYTMAQTTQIPETDFGFSDSNTRYLQSGWSFYVGAGVALAGGIVFNGEFGDF